MADLTATTTFTLSVQGNRRVIQCDVSSANFTTSDTVTIPYLSAITAIIGPRYHSSVFDPIASTAMVGPFVTVGSAANTVVIARSSLAGLPVRFSAEGR